MRSLLSHFIRVLSPILSHFLLSTMLSHFIHVLSAMLSHFIRVFLLCYLILYMYYLLSICSMESFQVLKMR
uniref:Putative ovule protein n=1 Tax=Solanum chacoense TaxID=4108 RepID=A0A0V0GJQ4_SOLCH